MKAIQEVSVDTRLLHQRLTKLESGESITYAELSALIGRDVTDAARHSLSSARRMAVRDGIVTDAVRDVGIKRLTPEENIDSTGVSARQRIRRAAHRAAIKLQAIGNFDSLPPAYKIKQNAEVSQLAALKAFSSDKVTKRIDNLIDKETPGQLAIAKTLKAFE